MNPEWRFYPTDEFLALPCDPDPWLIRPLVPAAGWVSLFGQPKKARKSYLAMGMANAIGDPNVHSWLSFPVAKHGTVMYVQVDTPHDLWAKRVRDIKSGAYGAGFENVWWSSIQYMPYPFDVAKHADILRAMVQHVEDNAGVSPVCIIYDTARKMHALDENSSQDMTVFMGALEEVAGPDKAKILVSHDKKNSLEVSGQDEHETEGGDLMKGQRGSSAIAGAVDTIIKMTPKGNMYYQGRAVGEEHKKLAWQHVHNNHHPCPYTNMRDCNGYVWIEDADPAKVEARQLLQTYKNGSIYSLAQILSKSRNINFNTAKSILARLPEAKGRKGAVEDADADNKEEQ